MSCGSCSTSSTWWKVAAGRARDRVEQIEVHVVAADADAGDGHLGARERGDHVGVVLGGAIAVAVGQEDHVADRAARGDEVAPRDVERLLEIGAAAVLDLLDLGGERRPALARRQERPELVGLRVEGDRRDEIALAELIEHGERGPLGVRHLLAVVQRRRVTRVAHAVGAVDDEIERDRLALLRRGALGLQRHRQHALERASRVGDVAEEMLAAGRDQAAAARDPGGETLEGRVGEVAARDVVEDHQMIRREAVRRASRARAARSSRRACRARRARSRRRAPGARSRSARAAGA